MWIKVERIEGGSSAGSMRSWFMINTYSVSHLLCLVQTFRLQPGPSKWRTKRSLRPQFTTKNPNLAWPKKVAAVQINLTHCSVHLQCGNEPGYHTWRGDKIFSCDLIRPDYKCTKMPKFLTHCLRGRENQREDGREMPLKTKEIAETVCAAFEAGAEAVVNSSLT